MKKVLSLIVAVVICLSLCACGGDDTNKTTDPAGKDQKLVSVEVTVDNWRDYFELREYTEIEENGFGEVDDATIYWTLISKDEYAIDVDNCDVTFEYTCDVETTAATINTETKALAFSEATDSKTSDSKVETMNGVGQYIGKVSNERYGELLSSNFFRMENGELVSVFDERIVGVTVTRISGTFSYFE